MDKLVKYKLLAQRVSSVSVIKLIVGVISAIAIFLSGCNKGFVVGEPQSSNVRKATRAYASLADIELNETGYGGVGLFIMPYGATLDDADRFRRFCERYVTSLDRDSVVNLSRDQRMITFWPVQTAEVAELLNGISSPNLSDEQAINSGEGECTIAVQKYDSEFARSTLDSIRSSENSFTGRGPFLVAWSPPIREISPYSVTMVIDMSAIEVVTDIGDAQAGEIFQLWQIDLSRDVSDWSDRTPISESFRLRLKLKLESLAADLFDPFFHSS